MCRPPFFGPCPQLRPNVSPGLRRLSGLHWDDSYKLLRPACRWQLEHGSGGSAGPAHAWRQDATLRFTKRPGHRHDAARGGLLDVEKHRRLAQSNQGVGRKLVLLPAPGWLLTNAVWVPPAPIGRRCRWLRKPDGARRRRPTTAGRTGQARSALWRPGPSVRARVAGRSSAGAAAGCLHGHEPWRGRAPAATGSASICRGDGSSYGGARPPPPTAGGHGRCRPW